MTSITETAEIEQTDNRRPCTLTVRLFARLFGARTHRARRRKTIDQILLNAFGSISPAYLF